MGNVTTQIQEARARELRTLSSLYNMYIVGREYRDQSVQNLAILSNGTKDTIRRDIQTIEDLGILTRRLEYGTPSNGLPSGRHYHWTLNIPKDQALELLKQSQEKRNQELVEARKAGNQLGSQRRHANALERKRLKEAARLNPPAEPIAETLPEPIAEPVAIDRTDESSSVDAVTISESPREETRAIAGPDIDTSLGARFRGLAALRKDEVGALIEAARQYRNRNTVIASKLEELATVARTMGIEFDQEAMLASMKFGEPDTRLEAVGLLIPHIDSLNAQVERLTNQVVEQSDKVRRFNELDQENARLRRRNMELTTARTAASVASAH